MLQVGSRPDQSCRDCGKTLEHMPFVPAGQFLYHPDCLKCRHCQKKLTPPNIDIIGNFPYCQGHRGKDVGANAECPSCKKNFKMNNFADQVHVVGVAYHKNCLKCATCQKVVEADQWKAHQGALYCGVCFDLKNPKKCQKCKFTSGVTGEITQTAVGTWCFKCFACKNCTQKLKATDKFHDLGNDVYCLGCDAAYIDAKYIFDKMKSGS